MAHGKRWRISLLVENDLVGQFEIVFNRSSRNELSLSESTVETGMILSRMLPDTRIIRSKISEICIDCGEVTANLKMGSRGNCLCDLACEYDR